MERRNWRILVLFLGDFEAHCAWSLLTGVWLVSIGTHRYTLVHRISTLKLIRGANYMREFRWYAETVNSDGPGRGSQRQSFRVPFKRLIVPCSIIVQPHGWARLIRVWRMRMIYSVPMIRLKFPGTMTTIQYFSWSDRAEPFGRGMKNSEEN